MIERDAPAALQAVALLGRDNSTRRIGETIEPDVGIGHLDLRRDAELAADGRALAHFDAERLTATVIALGELAKNAGVQIAVIPAALRLTVDIEAIEPVPRQCCAKPIAIGLERAIAEDRPDMTVSSAIIGRDTSDQTLALIGRSEEHTSELQSLMRISYAVFCMKNNTK